MATANLFTFPTSGSAFTSIKLKSVDNDSLPPPRKAARLDSASHSPHKPRILPLNAQRPIKLLLETPVTPLRQSLPTLSNQVDQFIRVYLRIDTAPPPSSYEDIFNAARILVEAGEGENIKKVIDRSMQLCTVAIMKELSGQDLLNKGLDAWVVSYNERWKWWGRRLNVLRSTLVYLDTLHLVPQGQLGIKEAGYQVFGNAMFGSTIIQDRAGDVIRQWSMNERASKASPHFRTLVKGFIENITDLGRYEDHVEQPYLRFTTEHYIAKAKTSANYSALEYLRVCVADIDAEEKRGENVLREETVRLAAKSALCELVGPKVEWLAKDALSDIITTRDPKLLVHLHRLISLFALSSVPAEITAPPPMSPTSPTSPNLTSPILTSPIAPTTISPTEALLGHYRNDVFHRVKAIVTDTINDGAMVEKLLDLKEYLDAVLGPHGLDDIERGDRKWGYATSEAFERGFACRKIKPAEMIAKHIDSLMKKGQKSATDAEFFAQMKRVLALYRFSHDKDVFRTFYTRALAKRLLLDRSASIDFEKEVLKFLSESYDAAFTDCTQMFKDLVVSKDLIDSYRNVKRGHAPRPDSTLDVKVLQHSVWPVIRKVARGQAGIEIALPSRMELALVDYTNFYKERHVNRKLTWAHYLGTATLIARFPSGNKELTMSLYQAVVLLLFNEQTSWTMEDIKERVALGEPDLTLTVQSLALGKKPVLRRTNARSGKDIQLSDSFSFNEDFTDPKVKLHINTIQQTDTVEETQQAVKIIDQYRDASLDAAIVRIMKAKKVLKNQQLVNETIEAVSKHFKPEVKSIKARIESLMEREFITRKDGTADTWEYLA